jgi:hypothetical protein
MQVVVVYLRVLGRNFLVGRRKLISGTCSCKYLGIILGSDLSWTDQFNYRVKKAWKALHFTTRILKKGNNNTKSSASTSNS